MNHGIDASRDAIAALRKAVADVDDVEIAIFPAFTSLAAARDALQAARAAGAWTPRLEELATGVYAAARGPHWRRGEGDRR